MMAKRKRKSSSTPEIGLVEDLSWRGRADLDTLKSAHEVMSDVARMAAAKGEAKKAIAALERVSRLEGVNISGRGTTLRAQPGEKGSATNRHPKREGKIEKPGSNVDQSHVGKK
jgi:hypothetical protein